MAFTCPEGHTSSTGDFCDVCGSPISTATGPPSSAGSVSSGSSGSSSSASAGSAPAAAGSASASVPPAPPKTCPNCQGENLADALFCEDCGYDFTTGQLPTPPAPAPVPGGSLSLTPPTGTPAVVTPPPAGPGADAAPTWVAEVWVDPDWFAAQQAAGSCPASGSPVVVALPGPTAMIGRASNSRNLKPEIDCSSDGAISHAHARLSVANDVWSVEDLGSTNGTFVGKPDGTYPSTPLPPHVVRELADDERVYVGAWTRIVVRRATRDEQVTATP